MNPLVRKKIQLLEATVAEVQDNLAKVRQQTLNERANKERLIQQHWRERKELLAQRSLADDYQEAQQENERLKKERQELLKHLDKVMALIKTLGAELS